MFEDETINHEELARQVNRQIQSGIHGVFCLGTNGEGYALSFHEKLQVIEMVVKAAAGRVPIYAGTGCVTTGETIALTREAQEMGVDAITLITPYFAAASQDGLYRHFSEVAEIAKVPLLLYNIPMRTGNALSVSLVAKLAQAKAIAGVKDSSGNFDTILQYIAAAPKGFKVLSGTDSLILWTLLAGGSGAVSGMANIYPKEIASIYDLAKAGDIEGAQAAQAIIRPLRSLFPMGNPNTIVKRALNIIGFNVGPARRPFSDVPAELEKRMAEVIVDQHQNSLRR
jgi:4-hydroxy-tetrahydrodipicolinate synthase